MGQRNLQDAKVNPVAFALPAAASSSTNSTAIDFGSEAFKPEGIELILSVPALNATIVPNASTVDYIFETSTTSNFAAIDQTQSYRQTGAGGVGVGAIDARFRLPSNSKQYGRFKVTFGASTTTGAAVSATGKVAH